MKRKQCLKCGKWFDKNMYVSLKNWRITKYCSRNCYHKDSINKCKGENNPNWKSNNIGYGAIHYWLRITFGNPQKCENPNCLRNSKNFEWALIKNKKYERKRENFIRLCCSCHKKYDFNENWRKNLIISHLKNKIIQ